MKQKLTVSRFVKKCPAFYADRRFSTPSPSPFGLLILQQINPAHCLPNYWMYFLILFFSWWYLSFRFPQQTLVCISLLHHTCHIPCPSHRPWQQLNNMYHSGFAFKIFPQQVHADVYSQVLFPITEGSPVKTSSASLMSARIINNFH